ncbi:hypothetical protein L2E82_22965 [Cichorium intybus]|uniref:Uncharacterized protein n=1 Tax=Cichorium intybus TaxID=13427 RepID=A0ACB9DYV1_CICIN|nr:hypothetical protein L2E82_22965 [Cichorium intybus]
MPNRIEVEPNQGLDGENNQSFIKSSEPNLLAQNPIIENQKVFEDCSDTLKILLSRETPLKQKLKLMEGGKDYSQREKDSQNSQALVKGSTQMSPRITRSKARRRRATEYSKRENGCSEERSEESSPMSGISSRIAEIGEFFNSWMEEDGFEDLVREAWIGCDVSSTHRKIFMLILKLKKVKKRIKVWKADRDRKSQEEIRNWLQRLEER